MPSPLDIECPHCAARGQVIIPKDVALAIGPCPHCNGLVMLFSGQTFPLDKEAIVKGTRDERREHIFAQLNSFVESRLDDLLDRLEEVGVDFDQMDALDGMAHGDDSDPAASITSEEIRRFVSEALPRLDNHEYFRAIFEYE